jgi:shikimate dehydrogenase
VLSVQLSGETKLLPVVGDPIEQVLSPTALTALLAQRGRNVLVVPFHVPGSEFPRSINACEGVRNIPGVLVTIPHKRAALGLCTNATERARFAGSVNIMRKEARGWFGDNTDGCGYMDGIARLGFSVDGKSALLVGCGGAGSAIAFEILRRDAARLALHDVDAGRRDALIERLSAAFPGHVYEGSEDPTGYDLVANASPMGMDPADPLPILVDRLTARQFVACAITRPAVSPLVEEARKRGCKTMAGAGMFEAQAGMLIDFLLAPGPVNA